MNMHQRSICAAIAPLLFCVVSLCADDPAPRLAPIVSGRPVRDAMELRTILDWRIAPQLKQVRGVIEINPIGGFAASGTSPRRAKMKPILAPRAAIRTSIGKVMVMPTPTAGPLIAAIDGFRQLKIASTNRPPPGLAA